MIRKLTPLQKQAPQKSPGQKKQNRFLGAFAHILMPLALGTWIYLVYRSPGLLVFRWLEWANLHSHVLELRNQWSGWMPPELIRYSLPDGIWIYSATYFMFMVWEDDTSVVGRVWIWLPAVCGVGVEILQWPLGIFGTFDLFDLLFGIAAVLLVANLKKSKCKDSLLET